ncbi:uncharacterized protein LOC120260262 [Dioscorea cayenensis subsp. rotundata]|uniref:Uncharacterized protein LOC120260262 n=1 Tax=Dioscorea cayennensis subsp. rotundata TaxID=55577 RepID=A0AB40B8P6_DIOCR|nr:uncharacterized protein LOC120260262 [Dioscorea cayenensis subsp. rotundata]
MYTSSQNQPLRTQPWPLSPWTHTPRSPATLLSFTARSAGSGRRISSSERPPARYEASVIVIVIVIGSLSSISPSTSTPSSPPAPSSLLPPSAIGRPQSILLSNDPPPFRRDMPLSVISQTDRLAFFLKNLDFWQGLGETRFAAGSEQARTHSLAYLFLLFCPPRYLYIIIFSLFLLS